ncbi:MAG: hypothetical protein IJY50_09140 [Clostridia bacterium]|nr:hypothetical protein [Clostridia bacterium]
MRNPAGRSPASAIYAPAAHIDARGNANGLHEFFPLPKDRHSSVINTRPFAWAASEISRFGWGFVQFTKPKNSPTGADFLTFGGFVGEMGAGDFVKSEKVEKLHNQS